MKCCFLNAEEEAAFEKMKAVAVDIGFSQVGLLDASTLVFRQEVRDMCAANTCHMYGVNWACPPGCGTLEECSGRASGYRWGLLVQTVGELEDNMDIEAMMETEADHKEHFLEGNRRFRELYPNLMALGAGTCVICKKCSYPDNPCRFPERRISSMEAYGLVVSDTCTANGMKYYYGMNTIAYTSCYLLA